MPFFLINNPEISSCRWVVQVPEETAHPHYLAELSVFSNDQTAREYSADCSGLLVPGRPWVVRFAGVVNSSRLPVSLDYDQAIPSFLEEAAGWCALLPLSL
jgi:hypothetical protein